ncbi:MAG: hypothetical protein LBK73_12250 [Treponema sp.]|jgi:hypothetical protein|nr:hypothetical protein [Treponema sp.]
MSKVKSSPTFHRLNMQWSLTVGTLIVSIERGGAGTPYENISFRCSLRFKDKKYKRAYFHFGKILLASGAHNLFIWFPYNKEDGKKDDNDIRVSTGHGLVCANPRSDFSNASTNSMTSMSRVDILNKLFCEALAQAK